MSPLTEAVAIDRAVLCFSASFILEFILGQVWHLIVSFLDLCRLTYF